MTSFYAKMGLETYKMATSMLLKFLTLGWDISRIIWRIEVSDGSFFAFFTLSFEFKLFFDQSFPLNAKTCFYINRSKQHRYDQIAGWRRLLSLKQLLSPGNDSWL